MESCAEKYYEYSSGGKLIMKSSPVSMVEAVDAGLFLSSKKYTK